MSDLPLPNAKDLKRRYGITLDQYRALLDAQGGVCAICAKPPTQRTGPLVVDHDHDPPYPICGLVHGNPCNRRLTQQVRHYLADPPGDRFGWVVPAENEQRTIVRREAGKAMARERRAATRQGKQNARGVPRQGKQNGEGVLSRLDQLREMTFRERVERALAETRRG